MPYRPPPKIAQALIAERFRIQEAIANAVDFSFRAAFSAIHRPGEVEKLIYFFMEGLPIIENELNYILEPRGVKVTISGIFCHQTPKVRVTKPIGRDDICELGDIAFLATYDGKLGHKRLGLGNAVLMQAKENYLRERNPVQMRLYEECEEFAYASPNSLGHAHRDLSQANGCLYYWNFRGDRFLHRSYLHWMSTEAILARPKTLPNEYYGEPFEVMLAHMFCGIAGKGFQSPAQGIKWSKIIEDLIQTSASQTVNNRKVFALRGRSLSRLYNFMAVAEGASFVRCSIQEFFDQFGDKNLSRIGMALENESDERSASNEEYPDSEEFYSGELPPKERVKRPDGDGDGGSFVVFQFKAL